MDLMFKRGFFLRQILDQQPSKSCSGTLIMHTDTRGIKETFSLPVF
jgi:hypothetical protein